MLKQLDFTLGNTNSPTCFKRVSSYELFNKHALFKEPPNVIVENGLRQAKTGRPEAGRRHKVTDLDQDHGLAVSESRVQKVVRVGPGV